MPTEARIRELNARHHQLEARIEEELKHPSADTLQLARLKRQKLRLKEEIESLRRNAEKQAG
ncbi:DUF465 domain-containing protein [Marinicauda algicola]|uniref:DUF465 domain-containing protein n=1 Tax=Marinicauda algicola TaxID=2029849 RepID=A0A4S2H1U1_9PROT|nr:DUF465 domain-containing protein [Marinicauda algicola]TGY89268.1 DUF465 domain-containing protein [Marinicauda algicola]